MKKILISITAGVVILGLAALGASHYTKNRTGELAAALDNVNPLVGSDTVYLSTNVTPTRQFTGGGGEQEYEYTVDTVNAKGEARKIQFLSQWRLKPNRFLAVKTKGQNVESWRAVAVKQIPQGAWAKLS